MKRSEGDVVIILNVQSGWKWDGLFCTPAALPHKNSPRTNWIGGL